MITTFYAFLQANRLFLKNFIPLNVQTPRIFFFLSFVAFSLLTTEDARSNTLLGKAVTIDGDTLRINGEKIRLHGIDAPESGQYCEHSGKLYSCGINAKNALKNMIGRNSIRCVHRDIDRYNRIIGTCFLGLTNLNDWIVTQGLALAYRKYSSAYVKSEEAARSKKVGIWKGSFIEPWRWRRGRRMEMESIQRKYGKTCNIKGNISKTGKKIFHLPGDQSYIETRIDQTKGERWFCSAKAAVKSGWKRAKR